MIKCWYHSVDLDGRCAGAIVKFAKPEAVMYPFDYGEEFPWSEVSEEDTVYMVDISLEPFEEMVNLAKSVKELIWIDHHKSAIKEYHRMSTRSDFRINIGTTREGIGACQLVWEYLMPPSVLPLPKAVEFLAKADVRIWDDPLILPFKYGIQATPTHPESEIWRMLFSEHLSVAGIADKGKTIQGFQEQHLADMAKEIYFEVEYDGLKLVVANRSKPNSSFLWSVYDRDKHDAMACFYWKQDRWLMDLYTKRDDLDLGAFCKKRGGGGHKKAAGMPLSFDEVETLLRSKPLF